MANKTALPVPAQVYGARWLAARDYAWLADVPGYGKTAQAVLGARIAGHKRILIACPSIARRNWRDEVAAWWPAMADSVIVIDTWEDAPKIPLRGNKPLIVILSVDMPSAPGQRGAKIIRQRLKANRFDLLILDEAHYLKTPDSLRTKCFYGKDVDRGKHSLAYLVDRAWLLSASPAPNSFLEMWTHLRTFWPELIWYATMKRALTYEEFMKHFFVTRMTKYGYQTKGYANRPRLEEIMRLIMLRRTYVEGLQPVEYVEDTEVTGDQEWLGKLSEHEEFSDIDRIVEAAFMNEDGNEETELRDHHLATLRRLTAMAKVGPVVKRLIEDHGPDDKVLLFCVHREPMDYLEMGLREAKQKTVRIDGSTPRGARYERMDAFNNDPDVRFALLQIEACKTAINMPAATWVRFFERSFCPEDNYQAAYRGQRRGREGRLKVGGYALAGSFDRKVQEVARKKAQLIDEVIRNVKDD